MDTKPTTPAQDPPAHEQIYQYLSQKGTKGLPESPDDFRMLMDSNEDMRRKVHTYLINQPDVDGEALTFDKFSLAFNRQGLYRSEDGRLLRDRNRVAPEADITPIAPDMDTLRPPAADLTPITPNGKEARNPQAPKPFDDGGLSREQVEEVARITRSLDPNDPFRKMGSLVVKQFNGEEYEGRIMPSEPNPTTRGAYDNFMRGARYSDPWTAVKGSYADMKEMALDDADLKSMLVKNYPTVTAYYDLSKSDQSASLFSLLPDSDGQASLYATSPRSLAGLMEDATPKERLQAYYNLLVSEQEKLSRQTKIDYTRSETIPTSLLSFATQQQDVFRRRRNDGNIAELAMSLYSGMSAAEKRQLQVVTELISLAPIVRNDMDPTEVLDANGILEGSYLDAFGIANADRTKISAAIQQGLQLAGVSAEEKNKQNLEQAQKMNWKDKSAQVIGTSGAIATQMMMSGGVGGGLGKGAIALNPLNAIRSRSKVGKFLLRSVDNMLESGVRYQVAGAASPSGTVLEDELTAGSGIFGGLGQAIFTPAIQPLMKGMASGVGRFIANRTGAGMGEVAEETFQEFYQGTVRNNGDFKKAKEEFVDQFGNVSDASFFFLSSFAMGFAMGGGDMAIDQDGKSIYDDFVAKSAAKAMAEDPEGFEVVSDVIEELVPGSEEGGKVEEEWVDGIEPVVPRTDFPSEGQNRLSAELDEVWQGQRKEKNWTEVIEPVVDVEDVMSSPAFSTDGLTREQVEEVTEDFIQRQISRKPIEQGQGQSESEGEQQSTAEDQQETVKSVVSDDPETIALDQMGSEEGSAAGAVPPTAFENESQQALSETIGSFIEASPDEESRLLAYAIAQDPSLLKSEEAFPTDGLTDTQIQEVIDDFVARENGQTQQTQPTNEAETGQRQTEIQGIAPIYDRNGKTYEVVPEEERVYQLKKDGSRWSRPVSKNSSLHTSIMEEHQTSQGQAESPAVPEVVGETQQEVIQEQPIVEAQQSAEVDGEQGQTQEQESEPSPERDLLVNNGFSEEDAKILLTDLEAGVMSEAGAKIRRSAVFANAIGQSSNRNLRRLATRIRKLKTAGGEKRAAEKKKRQEARQEARTAIDRELNTSDEGSPVNMVRAIFKPRGRKQLSAGAKSLSRQLGKKVKGDPDADAKQLFQDVLDENGLTAEYNQAVEAVNEKVTSKQAKAFGFKTKRDFAEAIVSQYLMNEGLRNLGTFTRADIDNTLNHAADDIKSALNPEPADLTQYGPKPDLQDSAGVGFAPTRPDIMPIAPMQGKVKKVLEVMRRVKRGLKLQFIFSKPKLAFQFGSYESKGDVTKLSYQNDLQTFSHELGHVISSHFGVLDPEKARVTDEIAGELAQMAASGSSVPEGHPDPVQYMLEEGFAQFMRNWVVNPDATAQAFPATTKLYQDTVSSAAQKTISQYSDDVRTLLSQSATDRMASIVTDMPKTKREAREATQRGSGVTKETVTRSVKARIERLGFFGYMNVQFFDAMAPVFDAFNKMLVYQEMGMKNALGAVARNWNKIKPSQDVLIRARTFLGFHGRMKAMFENGFETAEGKIAVDAKTGEVVTMPWMMSAFDNQDAKTLEEEMSLGAAVMIAQRVDEKFQAGQTYALPDTQEGDIIVGDYAYRVIDGRVHLLKEDGTPRKNPEPKKSQIHAHIINGKPAPKNLKPRMEPDTVLSGSGLGFFRDIEEAQKVLAEFDELRRTNPGRHARVTEGMRRYRVIANVSLKYMVSGGRISQEEYNKIVANNEQYVAMNRLMISDPDDHAFSLQTPGSSLVDGRNPLKKFKGSGRTIINPYLNLMAGTVRAYRETDRNLVVKSFTDMAKFNRPQHGAPLPASVRDIAIDVTSEMGSQVQSGITGSKNVIAVYENGQKKFYKLDEEVYRAFSSMYDYGRAMPWLLTSWVNVLKSTITSAPTFAARNFIRDTLTRMSGVTATSGSLPIIGDVAEPVLAMRQVLTQEHRADFERYGASQGGYYNSDPGQYYLEMAETMTSTSGKKFGRALSPKFWWDNYQDFLSRFENANRFREYKRAFDQAKKEGLSDHEAKLLAAFKARDLMDFAVGGEMGIKMNKIIPFFNPWLRGMQRTFQAARENPARFTALFMAYSVAPAIAMRILAESLGAQDEYDQLPAYQRDLFYNIPSPDGSGFITIPKPHDLGMLGSGAERVVSNLVFGDKHSLDGYAGSLSSLLLKPEILYGPLPPLVENLTNWNFFRKKHIVPVFEEGRSLALRKGTVSASVIGKGVSDGLASFGIKALEWDPRKIDNFMLGSFGYLGDYVIRTTNTAFGSGEEFRDYDGFGDFIRRFSGVYKENPYYTARDVQWLMEYARSYNLEQRGEYEGFKLMMQLHMDAKDENKDQAGKRMVTYAKTIRKVWEENNIGPIMEKVYQAQGR